MFRSFKISLPVLLLLLGLAASALGFAVSGAVTAAVAAAAPPVEKTACLTYDDGPSESTPALLKTLEEKGVRATFFVTAQKAEHLSLIREETAAGHVVAPHSFSHAYGEIYSGPDAFWRDFSEICAVIEERAGFVPALLRFPGGSSNSVAARYGGSGLMARLIDDCAERGISYVDWNVDTSDNLGRRLSADAVFGNFKRGYRNCEDKSNLVVLMHDSHLNSSAAEATALIIDFLRAEGYSFVTADELSAPVRHRLTPR